MEHVLIAVRSVSGGEVCDSRQVKRGEEYGVECTVEPADHPCLC